MRRPKKSGLFRPLREKEQRSGDLTTTWPQAAGKSGKDTVGAGDHWPLAMTFWFLLRSLSGRTGTSTQFVPPCLRNARCNISSRWAPCSCNWDLRTSCSVSPLPSSLWMDCPSAAMALASATSGSQMQTRVTFVAASPDCVYSWRCGRCRECADWGHRSEHGRNPH